MEMKLRSGEVLEPIKKAEAKKIINAGGSVLVLALINGDFPNFRKRELVTDITKLDIAISKCTNLPVNICGVQYTKAKMFKFIS